MKDAYRYVIHAYEDARQKRSIKHEHGGTTVLNDGAEAPERVQELAREFPMGGSTSTSVSALESGQCGNLSRGSAPRVWYP